MNAGAAVASQIQQLSIAELHPFALNPRKAMDAAQLAELAQSIAEIGVTNPVLVRSSPTRLKGEESRYEIVAGHRRVEAAKLAGLTTVPVVVRDMSDAEAMDVALVDNLQRVDLSPMEEADGYRVLAKSMAWGSDELDDIAANVETIARKAGKTAGYVRSRLKLLELIQPAQDALREQLIGFDAALLIAKLEPEDQDKATARALGGFNAKPGAEKALEEAREQVADERAELAKNPEYCDPEDCYQPLAASRLKAWIEENLLLDLANAPWPLESASVLPEAGPCTTCPKRSGTDAALFADLTVKQDICTDSACFAAKKKAFVQIQMAAAKASGKPVVKISDHHAVGALKDGAELEKTTFKKGQWVASKEGACAGTYQGVTPEGELRWVCVLQSCKVHKHQVQKAAAGGARVSVAEAQRQREEEEKLRKRIEETEGPIREKIWSAILGKLDAAKALRMIADDDDAPAIRKSIQAALPKADGLTLEALTVFWLNFARELRVNSYWMAQNATGVRGDRECLWKLAKAAGVNADALAAQHFHVGFTDAKAVKTSGLEGLYPKGVAWPKSAKMPSPKAPVKTPTSSPVRKVKDKPVKAKAAKKAVHK